MVTPHILEAGPGGWYCVSDAPDHINHHGTPVTAITHVGTLGHLHP